MEQLVSKLQEILSTKEGQDSLNQILQSVGSQQPAPQNNQNNSNISNNNSGIDLGALSSLLNQQGDAQNQQNNSIGNLLSGLDMSKLSGLLSSLGGEGDNQNSGGSLPGMGNFDMGMLLKLQPMLQNMNKEDKNTRLMSALKEHVKPSRLSKIDQAINIMRLISLLPMLKEIGLFGGGK